MAAIMYQNIFLYNLITRMLHGGFEDYKIIANMVVGKSILDLACASCIISKFLPKNINYEGWDINKKFVTHNKMNGINVKQKNVFDIS